MANLREIVKNGRVTGYKFTACLGRDHLGKQVRKYTTWTPPDGLTPTKARKAAERAADDWEMEVREEYQKEKELGAALNDPTQSEQTGCQLFGLGRVVLCL